ncbi:hypothetical protein SCHPADRAFT_916380 [Schizopora paradoxa]|uniref:Uncharacterized protein n=1 Tax=Schizopora paradoxa TaxID=27342 RepID=A0A0H2RFL1_9AGAM|nr:hypothetical protein SCHPADRAFT_916380 [Schizopora paradoxa]
MPRLSEYELQRQAKIKENQELMKSLGILEASSNLVSSSKKAKATETTNLNSERKNKRKSLDSHFDQPRRKSARLSASASTSKVSIQVDDNLNSDPIDFLSTPPKKALALRKPPKQPIIEDEEDDEESVYEDGYRAPPPKRDSDGTLIFEKEPVFRPNLTPEEILKAGSFGGTAFRSHFSRILNSQLSPSDYEEFPRSWYSGLDTEKYLTSTEYDASVNKYGVKAGQALHEWENAGWVRQLDPRGWFQWYCRYYLGRRTRDDERQIKRWAGVCGPSGGRFKNALVKKIAATNGKWNDPSISPIIRQTLQHWGYRLTEEDYLAYF